MDGGGREIGVGGPELRLDVQQVKYQSMHSLGER